MTEEIDDELRDDDTGAKDRFVKKLYKIARKKKRLKRLAAQREVEEQRLAAEYRVNEVNIKRDNLMKEYAAKMNQIHQEIVALEEDLV